MDWHANYDGSGSATRAFIGASRGRTARWLAATVARLEPVACLLDWFLLGQPRMPPGARQPSAGRQWIPGGQRWPAWQCWGSSWCRRTPHSKPIHPAFPVRPELCPVIPQAITLRTQTQILNSFKFSSFFSTKNKHTQKLCTMVDSHDLTIASGETLSLIDMNTKSTLGVMLQKSTHIEH